jgi:hypothetical protein
MGVNLKDKFTGTKNILEMKTAAAYFLNKPMTNNLYFSGLQVTLVRTTRREQICGCWI